MLGGSHETNICCNALVPVLAKQQLERHQLLTNSVRSPDVDSYLDQAQMQYDTTGAIQSVSSSMSWW